LELKLRCSGHARSIFWIERVGVVFENILEWENGGEEDEKQRDGVVEVFPNFSAVQIVINCGCNFSKSLRLPRLTLIGAGRRCQDPVYYSCRFSPLISLAAFKYRNFSDPHTPSTFVQEIKIEQHLVLKRFGIMCH
jgi:hypothetical protein